MEFGTSTGRQGTFDVKDPRQRKMAISRLSELQTQYGEMLNPNYTGSTGYADAGSYSTHKNAVTEAQNIQRGLQGDSPLAVRFNPHGTGTSSSTPSMPPPGQGAMKSRNNYITDQGRYYQPGQMAVINGPGGGPRTYGDSATTFGADVRTPDIAMKQRQLAIAGLDNELQKSQMQTNPMLRHQERNIESHGTIENPFPYKQRIAREEAAELTDPASPRGALAEQEFGRKLQQTYQQNVLPAQIGAQSRLGVAEINQDSDRYVADQRFAGEQENSQASQRAAALRALAAMFGFNEDDLSEEDVDIRRDMRRQAGF